MLVSNPRKILTWTSAHNDGWKSSVWSYAVLNYWTAIGDGDGLSCLHKISRYFDVHYCGLGLTKAIRL